jgi:hypothetical protein
MIRIPHTVNLVTELDETNPTAQQLLALPNPSQFLAEMFESILISEGWLDEINAGGSFAFVKLDN